MATLDGKIRLLRGLLTGEVAKTGPFYVDVGITRRCNLRCLGCRYHSSYVDITPQPNSDVKDIPLDLFKRLCDELKTMSTHSLILQGAGEPLLHRDLFEMVSTAKAAGFHVTLLTNGTLLDQDIIQALMDTRLDILKVSLWASSTEQYQQNYPDNNPDNFRKIVDGLKLLESLKAERGSMLPMVQLHHPINCYNFETVDAFVNLAVTTGCNGVTFSPFNDFWGALAAYGLTADQEQLARRSLLRAREQLDSLSMTHNIDDVLFRYEVGAAVWQKLPCYVPWFHVRITVDGAVLPCGRCKLGFGNLNENSFQDIWNGPAIRAFRRRTLTRKGLEAMVKDCNCGFCCYVGDNMRIHRLFGGLSPFVRRFRD